VMMMQKKKKKEMQQHMYRIGHLYQICLTEVMWSAEVRQGLPVCYFGNSSKNDQSYKLRSPPSRSTCRIINSVVLIRFRSSSIQYWETRFSLTNEPLISRKKYNYIRTRQVDCHISVLIASHFHNLSYQFL
jgi:hypothetical protein